MAVKKAIEITPYDTPWEIACMLIGAKYEYQNILNETVVSNFFDIEDLRRIGEHLINYCNVKQEKNNE